MVLKIVPGSSATDFMIVSEPVEAPKTERPCPNCGRVEHSEAEWAACKLDVLGPCALTEAEQVLAGL